MKAERPDEQSKLTFLHEVFSGNRIDRFR